MTLICLSHCYSGITYSMQQNLVLTNTPFDAQKSKLNLYFSFCNANNHASVFYLPCVYLSILKMEHFFPTLSSFLLRSYVLQRWFKILFSAYMLSHTGVPHLFLKFWITHNKNSHSQEKYPLTLNSMHSYTAAQFPALVTSPFSTALL